MAQTGYRVINGMIYKVDETFYHLSTRDMKRKKNIECERLKTIIGRLFV